MTDMTTPVSRAVAVFGTQAAVAEICGVKQPTVSEWKDGRIPVQHIPKLIAAARTQDKALSLDDLIPTEASAA